MRLRNSLAILVLTSVLLGASWVVSAPLRVELANSLVTKANQVITTKPAEAVSLYRQALYMQPNNNSYVFGLGKAYFYNRQLTEAAAEGDNVTKAAVLAEQGQTDQALALLRTSSTTDAQTLYGLLMMTQQGTEQRIQTASQASPQAAGALKDASTSETLLAQELYARGLDNTAKRVLLAQDYLSSADYLVLAECDWDNLNDRHNDLSSGAAWDPANKAIHQELLSIDKALGLSADADTQQSLLNQLDSGEI